jgi:hypothetical protein
MKFRGGEFSTGTMRNFQPELTKSSEVASMNDIDALAEVAQNNSIRNFDEC